MAKKRQADHATEPSAETVVANNGTENGQDQTTTGLPSEELGHLAGEVQSFISRRDELAQKLKQEIEATEKKLLELRRTAALLFPENGNHAPKEKDFKERKAKKPSKAPKVSQVSDDASLAERSSSDSEDSTVPNFAGE